MRRARCYYFVFFYYIITVYCAAAGVLLFRRVWSSAELVSPPPPPTIRIICGRPQICDGNPIPKTIIFRPRIRASRDPENENEKEEKRKKKTEHGLNVVLIWSLLSAIVCIILFLVSRVRHETCVCVRDVYITVTIPRCSYGLLGLFHFISFHFFFLNFGDYNARETHIIDTSQKLYGILSTIL